MSTIGRLATVYEVARNAMEYRADHLVRRAAIARILRRQLVFDKNPQELGEQLLTELQWALYLTEVEERRITSSDVANILSKYMPILAKPGVPWEWLIGLISAQIEEQLNPNIDYHRFTTFAFHTFKYKVDVDDNPAQDLILFVAVDQAFSQSDEPQVAYHLLKLIKSQADKKNDDTAWLISETWRHYQEAKNSPLLAKLMAFVRRNMGPLVLIRDMYFFEPQKFKEVINLPAEFEKQASLTLSAQLALLSGRIRNATIRSLLYVFLTKMLVVLLIEMPFEKWIYGHIDYIRIAVNVIIPVGVMWLLTASVRLPSRSEQKQLVEAAGEIVSQLGTADQPGEKFINTRKRGVAYKIFSVIYTGLFMGIFLGLAWILRKMGYGIVDLGVFLFFLCVVSFFAYRIRQSTLTYQFRKPGRGRGSMLDLILLPVVSVGGWLSSGVAKLNFLVFVFDFVLEAPFKLVLRFLDNWFTFLARKKDEIVG